MPKTSSHLRARRDSACLNSPRSLREPTESIFRKSEIELFDKVTFSKYLLAEVKNLGRIIQKAEIENTFDVIAFTKGSIPKEQVRKIEIEFLVDTGAAMVCLTPNLIQTLGLEPLYVRNVITANGKVQRRVFSPAQIRIWDRESNLEVMEIREGTPALLGYLALESLDLYPNPLKQILEGNPKYNGKMVMDLLVS